MKKIEKQSFQNVMNLFMIEKSTLKRFGFINPSSGLSIYLSIYLFCKRLGKIQHFSFNCFLIK